MGGITMKKSRERMKGFVIGFVAAMVLSSSIVAAASTGVMREIFFGVTVTVHGEPLELADDMQPFIMGGRTFLPARIVEQIADMPVNWDGETQTVVIGRIPLDEEALLGRWKIERVESFFDGEIVRYWPYSGQYFEFFADGTLFLEGWIYEGRVYDDILDWSTARGQIFFRSADDTTAIDAEIVGQTLVLSGSDLGTTLVWTLRRVE
jgi:hypothetical protein